jgi:hypothetical protein
MFSSAPISHLPKKALLYFFYIFSSNQRSRIDMTFSLRFQCDHKHYNAVERRAMSLASYSAADLSRADDGASTNIISKFRFLPKELTSKCYKLVESYHAMHGFGCLPDMLWHSDARDIIECSQELSRIFKNASKSRCAKRANESLMLIATVILSLEILIRDFSGWGKRFSSAKRTAEGLLAEFNLRPRTWFLDQYLYPTPAPVPELARIIDPSPTQQFVSGSLG